MVSSEVERFLDTEEVRSSILLSPITEKGLAFVCGSFVLCTAMYAQKNTPSVTAEGILSVIPVSGDYRGYCPGVSCLFFAGNDSALAHADSGVRFFHAVRGLSV